MIHPTLLNHPKQYIKDNPYMPHPARIVRIIPMVKNNHLFQFRFEDSALAKDFTYRPGQFMMLSIIGTGEAPISISSTPTRPGILEMCVRRAGRVTNHLYQMKENDLVGLRGPYGNGFPVEEMKGHDLLLIAGGLGMAWSARGQPGPVVQETVAVHEDADQWHAARIPPQRMGEKCKVDGRSRRSRRSISCRTARGLELGPRPAPWKPARPSARMEAAPNSVKLEAQPTGDLSMLIFPCLTNWQEVAYFPPR